MVLFSNTFTVSFDCSVKNSKIYCFTGAFCSVSFWVHIGGSLPSSVPELRVYLTNVSYQYDYKFLGKIDGPLGDSWQRYEYALGENPANYQLEFMADPYDATKAEIALDDVEMLNCSPDAEPIDLSLDCDFEQDFCHYFKDKTGDFDWERGKGPFGGPGFDHTTGTGFYAYIDSYYPRIRGEKARIYSSMQTKSSGPMCFSFWYHMFGRDIDKLSFYIDSSDSGGSGEVKRELVWQKEGAQGNR
jgi:hypothetical protein